MVFLTLEKIIEFVGKIIIGERIKQFTNPLFSKHKDDFICRLSKIIHSSIDDFEKKYGEIIDAGAEIGGNHITIIAFYKSEKFISLLLKYKYYENHNVNAESIFEELKEDKRIITANVEQISNFLTIFNDKISKDNEIIKLEIEAGYKEKVYENAQKLDLIIELLQKNEIFKNYIKTEGNDKLIFQDINHSPITINVENLPEIIETLKVINSTESNTLEIIEKLNSLEKSQKEYYQEYRKNLVPIIEELFEKLNINKDNFLNVIVLSLTKEQFETISGEIKIDNFRYGNYSQEWQPFEENLNIEQILKEYEIKSSFKVVNLYIEYLDLMFEEKKELKKLIKGRKKSLIFIIDIYILFFEKYKFLIELFNEEAIGGCIIPIFNSKIEGKIISEIEKKFDNLYLHFFENLDNEYIQIELFVPTKDILFRRISNIAINKMGKEAIYEADFKKEIIRKTNKTIPNAIEK